MSVSQVTHGSSVAPASAHREQGRSAREQFARLQVGQTLELQIVRRLDDRRLIAFFDGTNHLVETAMALTAGNTLRANVVAIGDKLELKFAGLTAAPVDARKAEGEELQARKHPEEAERLNELQEEYAVSLHGDERLHVLAAMSKTTEPDHIARSGLYLSKLKKPVDAEPLRAIYAAISWLQPQTNAGRRALDGSSLATALEATDPTATSEAAQMLAEAFTGDMNVPSSELSSAEQDDSNRDALTRRLLNDQDDGSVAYAFGRVPLMVADQLVELDVVLFRDRQGAANRNATRRLVMSLKTEALGRVEVIAQAVGERLTISLNTESVASSESLAEHADEVRALVASFGWSVDTIRYDISATQNRAANHIVQHVLDAGTIDRMF